MLQKGVRETKKGTVPEIELFLGGTKLQECDSLDILGVNVQRNLSFTTHVDSIAGKAGKRLNVFRKVAPYMDTKG